MEPERYDLHHHIDQPKSWEPLPQGIIIRGWCFAAQREPIRAIRLRSDDLTLTGTVGLPRPDVRSALPMAPNDNTGFEIRGTLPQGRHDLVIEAGLADGTWYPLLNQKADVKRALLPRWLGGGNATELIALQMPAHMAYPARKTKTENFPASRPGPALPKISIVTPSYQQARFIGETIGGVLEQGGVNCEYVVQDGGSTDGSQALIARFAKEAGDGRPNIVDEISSRPQVSSLSSARSPCLLAWVSEADAGQADAIVKGFAKTSGGPDELMAWINSDDFYLPGALAYVANYFAHHPGVDVLYGHRIVVNEESQEIARWFLPQHDDEILRLNDFVPQETMFWRRRIWDKTGGLDVSFKFAMDWDLLLRFQAAGAKIVRIPYFLACFRVHGAQKTSTVMHSTGQKEITLLRERTYGRSFPPEELERNPRLLRYLRRSAFIEFLWKRGIRAW